MLDSDPKSLQMHLTVMYTPFKVYMNATMQQTVVMTVHVLNDNGGPELKKYVI